MLKRLLLPLITVLALAGCTGNDWRTTDISEVMPPLDFTLVNENGNTVTEADYAGKATVLFFGYTHCPDVCPATLARLVSITRQLDPAIREQVRILFVSVDPSRDTPERLATYTDAFGPQVVGLTGTPAELDAVTNRYRVTYSYDEPDENGNYAVTHSGAVFGFDIKDRPAFLAIQSDPLSDVKADIISLVEAGQDG